MAKLAQTQEPSMEEILASIRRIITEDEAVERPAANGAAAARPKRAEPAKPPAPAVRAKPSDDAYEPDLAEAADVLELSEDQVAAVHNRPETPTHNDSAIDDPPPRAIANGSRGAVATRGDDRLLSESADAVVTSAFSTLANTILSSEARTLEDIVREMLRPMLKAWLDDNLPPLVERLVRDEIERVARGRR